MPRRPISATRRKASQKSVKKRLKACRKRMSTYTPEQRKRLDTMLNTFLGVT